MIDVIFRTVSPPFVGFGYFFGGRWGRFDWDPHLFFWTPGPLMVAGVALGILTIDHQGQEVAA